MHGKPILQAVHASEFSATFPPMEHAICEGVGCVIQAVGRGCLADGEVTHARLHTRSACLRVNPQYAFQFRKRRTPSGEERPHRRPVPEPRATTGLSVRGKRAGSGPLLLRYEERYNQRYLPVCRQAIALVGLRSSAS
jgi:hypothetical protein